MYAFCLMSSYSIFNLYIEILLKIKNLSIIFYLKLRFSVYTEMLKKIKGHLCFIK